jgi:hypothetical protein
MKLKVAKVIVLTENENEYEGRPLCFDLSVSSGTPVKMELGGGLVNAILCNVFPKEIDAVHFPTEEDVEKNKVVSSYQSSARPIKQEEYDLIKEFQVNSYKESCEKHGIDYSDYEFDSNLNAFLVFDVSENHIRVLHTTLIIDENASGRKSIENQTIFYSIKDGVVLEDDEHYSIDDYEVNISEIKDLL